jgi:hypothetical protein
MTMLELCYLVKTSGVDCPLNAAIFVSYPIPKFKKIQREQTTTSDAPTFWG